MTTVYMKTRQIDPAAEAVTQPVSSASVAELILLRVRLRAQRRAAWLTQLGNNTEERTQTALDANLAACLDGRDTPEAEAAWYQRAEVVQSLNEELERVEQALAGESGARLQQLHSLFRLSEPEMDLLQTCLAPAIDPSLGIAYAYLQQHPARSYATEALAGRLFGYGRRSMWHAGGPLTAWRLVSAGEAAPGEPAPLAVDPFIIDWLQGELRMDPALVGRAQIVEPHKPLESWPVEMTARLIQHAIERESAVRVLLAGPPASGRRTFAAAVAARFGIQLLSVDTTEITDTDWPNTFMRAQRLAVMSGAALVWHGSRLDRHWPRNVAPAPLQFVACDPDQVVPPCEHIIDHRIDMPTLTLDERRRLWKANIPESATWPVNDLETLVTRYRLNAGDIVSVARRAPASARETAALARELTQHPL